MGTEDFEDTKLQEAVRYGEIDDVRIALKQGDNPNQIGIYQWNALHEASNNGDINIVKLLLRYGGDPNKADKLRGSTAVHYAASNGHPDVLKCLLSAGGLYDRRNNEGETSLDVAVNFECQKILRQQRDQLVIGQNVPKVVIEDCVLSDTKWNDTNNNNDNIRSISSSPPDLDDISIATNSSSDSRPHSRAWGPDRILGLKKEQVMGYIQLSFEYNAKKEVFKIRVWQVADILLPPPESSMISTLYVKSYLQPDSSRQSKRKTEEVRVDKSDLKEIKKKGQAHIVNFQPGCFTFTKALEYDKISRKTVDSRIVDVQVCITQRYTRKSFVLATFNLPMSMACKKLVKEKFSLKPCISTTLPENMKVYSASELTVSHGSSSSNPSLRRWGSSSSSGSWATPYPETIGSDFDLRSIRSTDSGASKPSVEIEIPDEVPTKDDAEIQEALEQIRIMEEKEKKESISMRNSHLNGAGKCADKSTVRFTEVNVSGDFEAGAGSKSELDHWSVPGQLGDELLVDEDGFEINVHQTVSMAEVQIHIPPAQDKKHGIHKPKQKKSILKKLSQSKDNHRKQGKEALSFVGDEFEDEESAIGGPSLTWDDYNDPPLFENDLLPLEIDENQTWSKESVCLPMATSFDDPLPGVHRSNSKLSSFSLRKIENPDSVRRAKVEHDTYRSGGAKSKAKSKRP